MTEQFGNSGIRVRAAHFKEYFNTDFPKDRVNAITAGRITTAEILYSGTRFVIEREGPSPTGDGTWMYSVRRESATQQATESDGPPMEVKVNVHDDHRQLEDGETGEIGFQNRPAVWMATAVALIVGVGVLYGVSNGKWKPSGSAQAVKPVAVEPTLKPTFNPEADKVAQLEAAKAKASAEATQAKAEAATNVAYAAAAKVDEKASKADAAAAKAEAASAKAEAAAAKADAAKAKAEARKARAAAAKAEAEVSKAKSEAAKAAKPVEPERPANDPAKGTNAEPTPPQTNDADSHNQSKPQ